MTRGRNDGRKEEKYVGRKEERKEAINGTFSHNSANIGTFSFGVKWSEFPGTSTSRVIVPNYPFN